MLWNSTLGLNLKINPKKGGTEASTTWGACKDPNSFSLAHQTCKLELELYVHNQIIKKSKTKGKIKLEEGRHWIPSLTSAFVWGSLLARTLFLHTKQAATNAKIVAKQTKTTATSGTLCVDFLWPPARQTYTTCKHLNTNLAFHIPSHLSVQEKFGLNDIVENEQNDIMWSSDLARKVNQESKWHNVILITLECIIGLDKPF